MKIIVIILILISLQFNELTAKEKLINIKTSDTWNICYIAGAGYGTLAVQKLFKTDWYKAGITIFGLALIKESSDELFKRYGNGVEHCIFDKRGGDPKDLIRALMGIAVSFPLRYKNITVYQKGNFINVGIKF